jgi:hypothetical protein
MTPAALNFDAYIDPQAFRGRRDLLVQVFDRLNHPLFLSSSIVGGPKTGKTSMLRYIVSSEADACCRNCIRLYLDAEPLGGNASALNFWISVFRAAQKQSPSDSLAMALTRAKAGNLDIYDLEDVFDHYAEARCPFVVAIDNFECLLQNNNFWPPVSGFFHDARSLAQREPRGLAYITGTTRPLLDLWDPTRGASPYYNIFANILVSRMADADIVEIVNSVCAVAKIHATKSLIDLVTDASDQHPGLVGTVAQFLAKRLEQGKPADEDSLAELTGNPIGPYVTLTRQIRTNLQPAERQLIDRLGQQPLADSSRRLLSQLRDYGLLPPGTEY